MFYFCTLANVQKENARRLLGVDDLLIERVAAGDMEAFAALYHETDRAVFAYALSILKNKHDAEEIMQETYLRIRAGAHLYEAQGKPMAWIFTIVRNLSFAKLRQRREGQVVSLEDWMEQAGAQEAPNCEDRLVLQAALSKLDLSERQIVMLHAAGGFKHREIAQFLGLSLSTVLSKYRRSLAKLQKWLREGE